MIKSKREMSPSLGSRHSTNNITSYFRKHFERNTHYITIIDTSEHDGFTMSGEICHKELDVVEKRNVARNPLRHVVVI